MGSAALGAGRIGHPRTFVVRSVVRPESRSASAHFRRMTPRPVVAAFRSLDEFGAVPVTEFLR